MFRGHILCKEIYSLRKEFALRRANSFLKELTPMEKGRQLNE